MLNFVDDWVIDIDIAFFDMQKLSLQTYNIKHKEVCEESWNILGIYCGRVSALLGLISTVHPPFRLSETRRLKIQPSYPRSMKGMDISNFFTNNDICILYGFEFWSLMQRCRQRWYRNYVLHVQEKYRQRIAQLPASDVIDHWSMRPNKAETRPHFPGYFIFLHKLLYILYYYSILHQLITWFSQ